MSKNQARKRDGGLTTWLVLILLGNAVFLVSLFAFVWDDFFLIFPFGVILGLFEFLSGAFLIPLWSITLFVIYSAVSICSVILLFAWRKWGFYAISITTFVAFVTGIITGILTLGIIVNCVSTIILSILLRSEWKLFHN